MAVPFGGGGNLFGGFDPAAQARLRGGSLGGGSPSGGGAATGAGQPPAAGGASPAATPPPNPHQGAVSLTPGASPLSYNGTDVAGQWNYGGAVSNPFRANPRPQGAGASPTPTPTPDPHGGGGTPTPTPNPHDTGDNSILLGSPNPAAAGQQQMPALFAGGGKAGIGAGMQPMNAYQRPANVAGGKGGGGGGGPAPGPGGGGGGGGGGEASPPGPDITIDKGNSPANPIGNQGAGPIPTTTNPKNAAPFSGLPAGGTNVPFDPNRNVVNDRPASPTQTFNPKTGKWEPIAGAGGGAGPIPTTTNPKNATPFSGLPAGGTNAPYDPNRNVVNDRPPQVAQTFNPKTGQWVPVPGINSANTQGPPPGPATTTNPPGGGPFAGLPPGGTTGTIGPNGAPAQQNAAANPLADLARMLGLGRVS